MRNLRFKQFLIGVVARTLETVIGRKLDPLTVAFNPDAAKISSNSLLALVARWTPVVETILSFVAAHLTPAELAARFSEDALLDEVVKRVNALLYAGKAPGQHVDFAKLVSDS